MALTSHFSIRYDELYGHVLKSKYDNSLPLKWETLEYKNFIGKNTGYEGDIKKLIQLNKNVEWPVRHRRQRNMLLHYLVTPPSKGNTS